MSEHLEPSATADASPSQPLTEFTLFPLLADDLRRMVWAEAMDDIKPRVIEVFWTNQRQFFTETRTPAILNVSKEVRGLVEKKFKLMKLECEIKYDGEELAYLLGVGLRDGFKFNHRTYITATANSSYPRPDPPFPFVEGHEESLAYTSDSYLRALMELISSGVTDDFIVAGALSAKALVHDPYGAIRHLYSLANMKEDSPGAFLSKVIADDDLLTHNRGVEYFKEIKKGKPTTFSVYINYGRDALTVLGNHFDVPLVKHCSDFSAWRSRTSVPPRMLDFLKATSIGPNANQLQYIVLEDHHIKRLTSDVPELFRETPSRLKVGIIQGMTRNSFGCCSPGPHRQAINIFSTRKDDENFVEWPFHIDSDTDAVNPGASEDVLFSYLDCDFGFKPTLGGVLRGLYRYEVDLTKFKDLKFAFVKILRGRMVSLAQTRHSRCNGPQLQLEINQRAQVQQSVAHHALPEVAGEAAALPPPPPPSYLYRSTKLAYEDLYGPQ